MRRPTKGHPQHRHQDTASAMARFPPRRLHQDKIKDQKQELEAGGPKEVTAAPALVHRIHIRLGVVVAHQWQDNRIHGRKAKS